MPELTYLEMTRARDLPSGAGSSGLRGVEADQRRADRVASLNIERAPDIEID